MFKIIFLAMILGVAAGVGAVYYQREVGELPIASADVEWESETLGTFSEPIVIAFGPPPSGDYQMDISGNLSIAGNRMPFAMDMDGTVEGRVRPDGIDMILGIGDLNAEFMDQRYSQQLDTTVTYRFDPDGRFLGADLSGLGGTASPLPMGQADEFRYLAAAFPPDGLRVGERIRFFDACAKGVMCPIGRGNIDYAAIHSFLASRGYAGYITIEQERDPRNSGSVLDDLVASRSFLSMFATGPSTLSKSGPCNPSDNADDPAFRGSCAMFEPGTGEKE